MFKRHGGAKGGSAGVDAGRGGGINGGGGADPAMLARYKNQAAKARDKIVQLVKEKDKAEEDLADLRHAHQKLEDSRDTL